MLIPVITGVFLQPVDTFRQLRTKHYVWWATLLLVIANLPNMLQNVPLLEASSMGLVVVMSALFSVVFTAISALIIHWAAQLLAGRGHFSNTYQALALSSLPLFFHAPLVALNFLRLLPQGLIMLSSMINIALMSWSFVLVLIAVRETHQLSTKRALLAVVSPMVVLFVLTIVMVVFVRLLLGVIF